MRAEVLQVESCAQAQRLTPFCHLISTYRFSNVCVLAPIGKMICNPATRIIIHIFLLAVAQMMKAGLVR
jgi:hypothetical protein